MLIARFPFGLATARIAALAGLLATPHLAAQGFTHNVVVLQGDPAADGTGTLDQVLEFPPPLNDSGRVLVHAKNVPPFAEDFLSAYGGGSPAVVLVRGNTLAPDGNGTFDGIDEASINSSGLAGFRGTIGGVFGSYNGTGVFTAGASATQVARGDEAAPGGNGILSNFPSLNFRHGTPLNATGQVAFVVDLDGTSGGTTDNRAVYLGSGGALTEIARKGQSVPGGSTLFDPGYPTLNDAGQVAFTALNQNSTRAIFRNDGGTLTTIAASGGAAPGGNGVYSQSFLYDQIHPINASGAVAFIANLTGTSGGSNDDLALFVADGSSGVQIAREGQAAPGGGVIRFFAQQAPALNDADTVAVAARVEIASFTYRDVILTGNGGPLTEIARVGGTPPEGNGTFGFFGPPVINNNGDVVFEASLSGSSGGAFGGLYYYSAASGTLLNVLRTGDTLAGSGINYILFSTQPHFGNAASGLNNNGQLSFYFQLYDGRSGIAISNPPENVSVTVTSTTGGPGAFTLNWTISNGGGVDIYRSQDLITWGSPIAVNVTTGTYTDTSAPIGGAFYVIVPTGQPYP